MIPVASSLWVVPSPLIWNGLLANLQRGIMATLSIRNWAEFQHYKNRCPPWIKLHRGLLDNIEYHNLSPESAKFLPLIWLLASENDGIVPPVDKTAFRLRISVPDCEKIFTELPAADFFADEAQAEHAESSLTPSQRKAQMNGFGSRHISDQVKREVWIRDGGKCMICSSTQDVEYDHIMPISKGGNSDKSNLQLLCLPCNRSKRTKVGKPAEQVATQNQQYSYDRHSLEGETERELELELEIEAALPSASPQPLTVVSKRGSRIQSTWKASEEMIQFCRTERPDLNPLAVEAEFLDYWSAQPGQRGVKLDWDATWRNWVRRQRAGPKPNGQSKTMQALDNIERQARQ